MGFSITWCAVREERADALLEELGLSPTGEREEFPESLISSAKLDTGWRVLWYNECGCPFLEPEHLQALSAQQDLVLCSVEEHVMYSSAELWTGGHCKWRIVHDGSNGPKGLIAEGTLPASLGPIRNEMERTQHAEGGASAEVDYIFEIPLMVAQALVGFKHDEDCPHMIGEQFEVLARS